MGYAHGKFVWFENVTTDADRAVAFYTELFNWSTEPFEMGPMGTYTVLKNGDVGIGGVIPAPGPEVPPHWIGSLSVEDVDATLAAITDAGGSVMMPPMDMPQVGRMAVALDPQGAAIKPFKGESGDPETPEPARTGDFCWNELWAKDEDAAAAFYGKVAGYGSKAVPMGDNTYYLFQKDGVDRGGMMKSPIEAPAFWLPYVSVEDVDATLGRVKQLGGSVEQEPMDVPGVGRIGFFTDPNGAQLALLSPAQ